ncbi:ATP-binding protein [Chryseobacterium sp. Tr-659]|uniref:ATP-binding protein n=1 Tax=Chryseobacterium sp. Tr-659 TaxID=2608340 RepID=UPI001420A25D|nr:ATP-binding protein [Chryseobacterium sp. Tr-659]NIF04007.1 ATP-binding protein [Chryseobacterium sp. Tr-659]
MKRIIFLVFAIAMACNSQAQNKHELVKLWQTDSVVPIPESVLINFKNKVLYVSEIGLGDGSAFDKNGAVGKVSMDGKIVDLNWVTGLHSPKGLAMRGNELYAADITELVVIDIKKANIIKKYPVPEPGMLNDVTVSDKGVIYFSDSKTKKIYQIIDQKLSVYMENIAGVNGLKAIGNELYILGGKRFFKVDTNKKETDIAQLSQNRDGIEPIGNGDFLITSWGGYVFYVSKDGKVETLLDTHEPMINAADLAYDATKKILYIPSFYSKMVTAYQLK